jgi:hypothetical protein
MYLKKNYICLCGDKKPDAGAHRCAASQHAVQQAQAATSKHQVDPAPEVRQVRLQQIIEFWKFYLEDVSWSFSATENPRVYSRQNLPNYRQQNPRNSLFITPVLHRFSEKYPPTNSFVKLFNGRMFILGFSLPIYADPVPR